MMVLASPNVLFWRLNLQYCAGPLAGQPVLAPGTGQLTPEGEHELNIFMTEETTTPVGGVKVTIGKKDIKFEFSDDRECIV